MNPTLRGAMLFGLITLAFLASGFLQSWTRPTE